jgi:hypothetical protein
VLQACAADNAVLWLLTVHAALLAAQLHEMTRRARRQCAGQQQLQRPGRQAACRMILLLPVAAAMLLWTAAAAAALVCSCPTAARQGNTSSRQGTHASSSQCQSPAGRQCLLITEQCCQLQGWVRSCCCRSRQA